MQILFRRCRLWILLLSALILVGCAGSSDDDTAVLLAGAESHYSGRTDNASLSPENAGAFVRSLFLLPYDPLVVTDTSDTRTTRFTENPWRFSGLVRGQQMLRAKILSTETESCVDGGSYTLSLVESRSYRYGLLILRLAQCDEDGILLDGTIRIGVSELDQDNRNLNDYLVSYSDLRRRARDSHYLFNGYSRIQDRQRCSHAGKTEMDLVIQDVRNNQSVWFDKTQMRYLYQRNCAGSPADSHVSIDGSVFHSDWGKINVRTKEKFAFETATAKSSNPYRIPDRGGKLTLVGEQQSRVHIDFERAELIDVGSVTEEIPNFTRIQITDETGVIHPIQAFTNADLNTGTLLDLRDSDRDTLPDSWETLHGLNPNDPDDAIADADEDGISNQDEFRFLGNPSSSDAVNIGGTLRISMAPGSLATRQILEQPVDVHVEGSNSRYSPSTMRLVMTVPEGLTWEERLHRDQCVQGREADSGKIFCDASRNAFEETDGKMSYTLGLIFTSSRPGNYSIEATLLETPDYFALEEAEARLDLEFESPLAELKLDAPEDVYLYGGGLLEPLVIGVNHATPSYAENVEVRGSYPQGLLITEAKAQFGDIEMHCQTVPEILCQIAELPEDQSIELVVIASGTVVSPEQMQWRVTASNADANFQDNTASSLITEAQSTDQIQSLIDAMTTATPMGYNGSYNWLTMPVGVYYGNINVGGRTVRLFGSKEAGGTTLIGSNADQAILRNLAVGSSVENFKLVVPSVAVHYVSRSSYGRESKVANNTLLPRRTLNANELEKVYQSLVTLVVPDGYSYGSMVIENNVFSGFGESRTRPCESLVDLPSPTPDYFRFNEIQDVNCKSHFR